MVFVASVLYRPWSGEYEKQEEWIHLLSKNYLTLHEFFLMANICIDIKEYFQREHKKNCLSHGPIYTIINFIEHFTYKYKILGGYLLITVKKNQKKFYIRKNKYSLITWHDMSYHAVNCHVIMTNEKTKGWTKL